MSVQRKALVVFLNNEPGMSDDTLVRVAEEILINTVPHLKPTVMMAPPTMQTPEGPEVTKA